MFLPAPSALSHDVPRQSEQPVAEISMIGERRRNRLRHHGGSMSCGLGWGRHSACLTLPRAAKAASGFLHDCKNRVTQIEHAGERYTRSVVGARAVRLQIERDLHDQIVGLI